MDQAHKFCPACRTNKSLDSFGNRKGIPGAYPICRVCSSTRRKLSYSTGTPRAKKDQDENLLWIMTQQLQGIFDEFSREDLQTSFRAIFTVQSIIDRTRRESFEIWLLLFSGNQRMLLAVFKGKIWVLPWSIRKIVGMILNLGFNLPANPSDLKFKELPEPLGPLWFKDLGPVTFWRSDKKSRNDPKTDPNSSDGQLI